VTIDVSHLDLLVRLLARDVRGVSGIVAASSAETLEAFGPFARRNQLSGFLHTVLDTPATHALFPPEMNAAFKQRFTIESRKRELLHRELIGLVDAFQQARIDIIILKGPELARRFYGSDDKRCYWDLDLLVGQDALGESRRLLSEHGFEQRSPMLFGERITLAVAHALDYAKGEAGVDLHWRFSSHPSFRVDYARVWERREDWALDGRSCSVLSVDYALTLNLLSSFKDIERGAFRLRSFVDLWMILDSVEADFAWGRFFSERNEENVRLICAGVLSLFVLVFQCGTRFPRLVQELERHPDAAFHGARADAVQLIEPTFLGPARRLWASRLYQMSRTRHFAWWALSLPVRLNVHKPGKINRFSQRIRRWLPRSR
jgi:hypothetical protein